MPSEVEVINSVLYGYGNINYPDDAYSVFNDVFAKKILAFPEGGVNQDLNLGATNNVMIDARNDIELTNQTAGKVIFNINLQNDPLSMGRQDMPYLEVDGNGTTVKITGLMDGLELQSTDPTNKVVVGDTTIHSSNDYNYFNTDQSEGFRFGHKVKFDSNVDIGTPVDPGFIVYPPLFTDSINLWRDIPNVVPLSCNVDRVGFALRINDSNQLEILKILRFSDGQYTHRVRRIGYFGHGLDTSNIPSDTVYTKYDYLNEWAPYRY